MLIKELSEEENLGEEEKGAWCGQNINHFLFWGHSKSKERNPIIEFLSKGGVVLKEKGGRKK
jgi:hypothetical protein